MTNVQKGFRFMPRTAWMMVILGISCALGGQVSAQDSPADQPPDISSMLAGGVTVVDAAMVPPEDDYYVTIENSLRLIRIYDVHAAEWQQYAFPDALPDYVGYNWLNEEQVLIRDFSSDPPYDIFPADTSMVLNLDSGTFEPPPTNYCNAFSIRQEAAWIPFTDPSNNRTALCNVLTGDFIFLFPNEFWFRQAETSPDGEWLAIAGVDDQTDPGSITLWSYDLLTHGRFRLGDFANGDYIGISWIEGRILLATRYMPEWSQCTVYTARPDQSGGLRPIISSFRFCPRLIRDTTTLNAMFDRANSDGTRECWITYADIETGQTWQEDYGELCWAEYTSPEGSAYHRAVNYLDDWDYSARTAELVRFDVTTGEQVSLYEGELERIVWVSDDERYALVVLGNNGAINLFPDADLQFPFSDGRLAYIDMETEMILYETPTEVLSNYVDGPYFPGLTTANVKIVSPNELLVITGAQDDDDRLLRVTLNADGSIVEEVLAEGIAAELPDQHYLLMQTEPEYGSIARFPVQLPLTISPNSMQSVSVYDAQTDTMHPLLTTYDPRFRNISVQDVQEDTASISVFWQPEGQPFVSQASYTVRFR
jgi:WD40 repeat protein